MCSPSYLDSGFSHFDRTKYSAIEGMCNPDLSSNLCLTIVCLPELYLFSPSAVSAIVCLPSPASRFHMDEDHAFRVAVIAVFASVNGSMVPLVDWVDRFTIRTHPDIRMSTSMLLDLRCSRLDTPLQNRFIHFKCHSISPHVMFAVLLD